MKLPITNAIHGTVIPLDGDKSMIIRDVVNEEPIVLDLSKSGG